MKKATDFPLKDEPLPMSMLFHWSATRPDAPKAANEFELNHLQIVERLVLFCMDSYDSESRRIFQDFSRSIRFAFLCTAQISKFQRKTVQIFAGMKMKFHFSFLLFQSLTPLCWNIEVLAVQKHVNLVDLVKSFPTNIWSQISASIQPGTDRSKLIEKREE